MLEHVCDECDDVEAGECCGIAFMVCDQPTAWCSPGKRSFYDPASRQENKASFRIWKFDDVKCDAFVRGRIGGRLTGVALIATASSTEKRQTRPLPNASKRNQDSANQKERFNNEPLHAT